MDEKARREQTIRQNIKRFREQAGLSQPELAGMVGVEKDTVSKWEQGTRKAPTVDNLMRLAAAFGRPMEHFMMENPPSVKPVDVPAFALKTLAKGVDDDLRSRALDAIAKINREHLDRVKSKKDASRRKAPRR